MGRATIITNEKYKELENYRIFPGDVIVTIMGTIGRSAVIPEDIPLAINTKHLAAITLNLKVANPIFLSYSIHSSPYIINQFKSKNRGAIMSGLNLTLIKETKIRRPPVERQNDFAVIHQHIDGIKSHYQQSLTELENLYGTLSQKAFKGELDLSRVVIVAKEEKESLEAAELEIHTATGTFVEPAIELPTPAVVSDLLDSERRLNVIELWFDSYFKQRSGMAISAQEFLGKAQQKLWELQEDDTYQLSVAEYDHVKELIFKAIESGRLTQTYYNVTNSLLISDALG